MIRPPLTRVDDIVGTRTAGTVTAGYARVNGHRGLALAHFVDRRPSMVNHVFSEAACLDKHRDAVVTKLAPVLALRPG
jgi:hypothetical protein